MRVLVLFVIAAVALPGLALAQTPPAPTPRQIQPAGAPPAAQAAQPAADAAGTQVVRPAGSRNQAVLFWIFALMSVGGALLTITRRNVVTAVMCLVATFIAVAALYVMLYAHFLAAIQVLVYAGAIMVLFVFVVMILNKEEEEPWALRSGMFGKLLAGAALLYLIARTAMVVWQVPTRPGMTEPQFMAGDFGTTASIGRTLFSTYLFPFEAISLVLLIAVVGALVLAHPEHVTATPEDKDPEAAEAAGGVSRP